MNQSNHAMTYVSDEHRKMVAGEWYLPFGPELRELRHNASMLAHEFNQLGPTDPARSRGILGQLFGNFPESSFLIPPASIDYGIHTFVGEGAYINFNVTILDSAEVHIGDRARSLPSGIPLMTFNDAAMPGNRPHPYTLGKTHGWVQESPYYQA